MKNRAVRLGLPDFSPYQSGVRTEIIDGVFVSTPSVEDSKKYPCEMFTVANLQKAGFVPVGELTMLNNCPVYVIESVENKLNELNNERS